KYSKQYEKWEPATPKAKSTWIDYSSKPYEEWPPDDDDDLKPWDQEQENIGELSISSTPAADVFLGGVDAGKITPASFTLVPGTYDVSLEAPGHKTWTGKAFVKAGKTEEIHAELKPRDPTEKEETMGYLSINTEPMGAIAIIDGIVMDYPTPTKVDLDPGTHSVVIRKKGYQDIEDIVEISAGETARRDYILMEKVTEDVWRVFVNSLPSGGKILVDGYFTGQWSDGYVDLNPGIYDISVQKGYLFHFFSRKTASIRIFFFDFLQFLLLLLWN
ncbi:hypothetical protein LCGC14_2858950, partial [marine sediment metagenome]